MGSRHREYNVISLSFQMLHTVLTNFFLRLMSTSQSLGESAVSCNVCCSCIAPEQPSCFWEPELLPSSPRLSHNLKATGLEEECCSCRLFAYVRTPSWPNGYASLKLLGKTCHVICVCNHRGREE